MSVGVQGMPSAAVVHRKQEESKEPAKKLSKFAQQRKDQKERGGATPPSAKDKKPSESTTSFLGGVIDMKIVEKNTSDFVPEAPSLRTTPYPIAIHRSAQPDVHSFEDSRADNPSNRECSREAQNTRKTVTWSQETKAISSKNLPSAEEIEIESSKMLSGMSEEEKTLMRKEVEASVDPELLAMIRRRAESKKKSQNSDNKPLTPSAVPALPKFVKEGMAEGMFCNLPEPSEEDILKMQWMGDLDQPAGEGEAVDAKEGEDEVERSTRFAQELASKDISELRFDFDGNLIAPSQKISVQEGLHHHGEKPTEAGYTALELIRLCRSSFAGQRTIAMKTISSILRRVALAGVNTSLLLHHLLEHGAAVLIRCGLDDKNATYILESLRAAIYLCVASVLSLKPEEGSDSPSARESEGYGASGCSWMGWTFLQSIDVLQADVMKTQYRGEEIFFTQTAYQASLATQKGLGSKSRGKNPAAPTGFEPLAMDLDDDKLLDEQSLAQADPITGLVKMLTLPKIVALLQATQKLKMQVMLLQLLAIIAQHSASCCEQVHNTPGLLDLLYAYIGDLSATNSSTSAEEDKGKSRLVLLSVRILRLLCQSSRMICSALLQSGIFELMKQHLIPAAAAGEQPVTSLHTFSGQKIFWTEGKCAVAEEVLSCWAVCLAYGINGDSFADFSILLQTFVGTFAGAKDTDSCMDWLEEEAARRKDKRVCHRASLACRSLTVVEEAIILAANQLGVSWAHIMPWLQVCQEVGKVVMSRLLLRLGIPSSSLSSDQTVERIQSGEVNTFLVVLTKVFHILSTYFSCLVGDERICIEDAVEVAESSVVGLLGNHEAEGDQARQARVLAVVFEACYANRELDEETLQVTSSLMQACLRFLNASTLIVELSSAEGSSSSPPAAQDFLVKHAARVGSSQGPVPLPRFSPRLSRAQVQQDARSQRLAKLLRAFHSRHGRALWRCVAGAEALEKSELRLVHRCKVFLLAELMVWTSGSSCWLQEDEEGSRDRQLEILCAGARVLIATIRAGDEILLLPALEVIVSAVALRKDDAMADVSRQLACMDSKEHLSPSRVLFDFYADWLLNLLSSEGQGVVLLSWALWTRDSLRVVSLAQPWSSSFLPLQRDLLLLPLHAALKQKSDSLDLHILTPTMQRACAYTLGALALLPLEIAIGMKGTRHHGEEGEEEEASRRSMLGIVFCDVISVYLLGNAIYMQEVTSSLMRRLLLQSLSPSWSSSGPSWDI
eukprot:768451-Hanusia_phi.AAC.4